MTGPGRLPSRRSPASVSALLDKAGQGPPGVAKPSKAARRVAGRTRATARRPTSAPAPGPDPQDAAAEDQIPDDAEADDGALAPVIPLAVFDAAEEAKRWW